MLRFTDMLKKWYRLYSAFIVITRRKIWKSYHSAVIFVPFVGMVLQTNHASNHQLAGDVMAGLYWELHRGDLPSPKQCSKSLISSWLVHRDSPFVDP